MSGLLTKDTPDAITTVRGGKPGILHLPTDRFRPVIAGGRGGQDPALRKQLKDIETDVVGLREDRVGAQSKLDDAKKAYVGLGKPDTDSDEFRAAVEARKAVGEIDDQIASKQAAKIGILELLGDAGNDDDRRDRDDARKIDTARDGAWNSKALFDGNDELKELLLKHAGGTRDRMGRVSLGDVADRDALKADVVGTANMRRGDYAGVLPQLRRNLRILDLIPGGVMSANTLPYTQESGAFTGAAETAEGAAKPEAGITFTDAEATARTIAAWLKLQKQSLEDFPALQSIIDNRLRYLVERRLEEQILAGNGTSPNIRGILNTSGIQAVAYAASTLTADQVLKGITNILLADAEATAIVMNPTDWQGALLAKASGDGHYFSGGPFSVTPQVMWGVPLIPSPAIEAGTVLVGDFTIGAQLFIRSGLEVLLSDSDQDDFTRNKVTLLAELRAALAVFRPAAFCTVDLTA